MDLDLPAPELAPLLLGAVLRWGGVAIRLTEVEAYAGLDDPASHAWRGPTPRAAVMFGPAGALYVYRSYGLHRCLNIVCGPDGVAAAVLLRAGEVVAGLELARERRGGVPDVRLARGPGCLGQALGATVGDSGRRLGEPGLALTPPTTARHDVASGPRVGISRAVDVPWRFWLPGEPTVSRPRTRAAG